MSGGDDKETAKVKEVIAGVLDHILTPLPGEALPRYYVAKHGRGGRGGALAAVPRGQLTITERAGHVRRLRKCGETDEATSLETETITLVMGGALRLTPKEALSSDLADFYPPTTKGKPK
jgi:hypothetical protein